MQSNEQLIISELTLKDQQFYLTKLNSHIDYFKQTHQPVNFKHSEINKFQIIDKFN